ncbi:iron-containing redox enzyme family protein, partial [Micromonospora sp. 4G55]|nr:iron-containing redox enzyme family protein [Micromonospora sp. 4G55]
MSDSVDRRYGPAPLPQPRGPVSAAVIEALRQPPHDLPAGLGAEFDPA